MHLIVGLGNPGKEYERTRHNVGFLVIDELINNEQLTINKKLNAEVIKTTLDDKRIIVAKPQTFMNNSGVAVQALLNFYKLTSNNLIVIHDDKDVPLGETRVQNNRGAAGHNGVLSIIEHVGTKDFVRIRVGITPSPSQRRGQGEVSSVVGDTANFVLGKFTKDEQKILRGVIENVIIEVKRLIV